MTEHELEGMRVKCENGFYSLIKNGRCMECGKKVKLVIEDGEVQGH